MPNGYQLKSARVLIGLEAADLAAKAKVDPSTIHRLESRGRKPVAAHAMTLQKILNALEREGVEITETGVQLIRHKK